MEQKQNYAEILAFAINNEQEAIDLYTDMANRTQSPSGKILFKELAEMARGDRSKLEAPDLGRFSSQDIKPPENLKISDYLVDVELKPDSSYQDILIFAAKQEQAVFELYTDLSGVYISTPEIKQMFEVLAQEEAYHKLKLEREYDDVVYKED